MISTRSRKRIAGAALASAAILGPSTVSPVAVADPLDAATCAVSSYGLQKLIRKATAVKYAAVFEVAALAIVGDSCKPFVKNLVSNQPATIDLHTNDNQTVRQQIFFGNLVAPSLPAPPPSGQGSLTAMIDRLQYRSEQCQGYALAAFYDACMRGAIDPVYR